MLDLIKIFTRPLTFLFDGLSAVLSIINLIPAPLMILVAVALAIFIFRLAVGLL